MSHATIALAGTGLQARTHARVLIETGIAERVIIASASRGMEAAEAFVAGLPPAMSARCAAAPLAGLAGRADALVTLSLAATPLPIGPLPDNGILVGVGPFYPEAHELDPALVASAETVISDHPERLRRQWAGHAVASRALIGIDDLAAGRATRLPRAGASSSPMAAPSRTMSPPARSSPPPAPPGAAIPCPEARMTSPTPIAFLQELIRLGRDGEAAVQARVADALAAIGCAVETVEYDPAAVTLKEEFATGQTLQPGQRRAVIGRLKGSGGGRSLILFAHPDGEPHGDLSRWSVDPFAGVIRDGRITGFGVADDLSGVAAMISGLALAQADGWRPAGDIIIASTPSKRHARGVAALLARMAPPDAALYLHPAESGMGMAEVKACTPGLLEFRISFAGKAPETVEPGQTAFAHRSVSAATVQAALLAALAELDAARGARIRHERIAGFVGRATNLHVSHATLGVTGKRNTIAVSGVIEGAVSMPPGERLADVQGEIAAAVEAVFQRAPSTPCPSRRSPSSRGSRAPRFRPTIRCSAPPMTPSLRWSASRPSSIRSTRRATSGCRSCRPAFPASGSGRSAATSPRTALPTNGSMPPTMSAAWRWWRTSSRPGAARATA